MSQAGRLQPLLVDDLGMHAGTTLVHRCCLDDEFAAHCVGAAGVRWCGVVEQLQE
ncbi:hypothetical protein ACFRU3_47715 [Streptomyces sp. NPDC056910]|uniref:hypothetical protein n=1 Tax=Streptomyces sp. NPDC056910 TaxID=3345964 RepID=UPI00369F3B4E